MNGVPLERVGETPLFAVAGTPITLGTLAVLGVILLVTFYISRLAQAGVRRTFAYRGVDDVGTVALTARLVSYLVLLMGFGAGAQTIGINLGTLFAAGAFFAVAMGFAMQNLAQNFISGLILLAERTIKPGDVLRVEDKLVRVSRMGLRATVARTRDEEDLIIPNSILVQNTVTNFTLRDSVYRLRAAVGVSYDSDMDLVMQTLRDAGTSLPNRLDTYTPVVLLKGFGDSSVNFEVSVWSHDPWAARASLSDLHLAIWHALKRAKITIPYPQRDIHVISQQVGAPLSLAPDTTP